MKDAGGALALAVLDRNGLVDELEFAKSPLPWPALEGVAAVPGVAAAAAVDVAIGVVVVVEEEDDEEAAAALAPVAPVFGDAVQRLLLYVDFPSFRTQLIHALSRLVRDVIQGLFRVV